MRHKKREEHMSRRFHSEKARQGKQGEVHSELCCGSCVCLPGPGPGPSGHRNIASWCVRTREGMWSGAWDLLWWVCI